MSVFEQTVDRRSSKQRGSVNSTPGLVPVIHLYFKEVDIDTETSTDLLNTHPFKTESDSGVEIRRGETPTLYRFRI